MTARLLWWCLLLAATAFADTLTLASGETFEGEYFGATSEEVRFIVDGKLYQFLRSEVSAIRLEPRPGSIQCPPCPPVPDEVSAGAAPDKSTDDSPEPEEQAAEASERGGEPPAEMVAGSVWLNAGTKFVVRLLDDIEVRQAKAGSTYHGVIEKPVEAEKTVAVPKGVEILLRLEEQRQVEGGEGKKIVGIRAIELSYRGHAVAIYTAKGIREGRDTQSKVTEGLARTGAKLGRIIVGGMGGAQASDTAEETIDDKFGDDTHLLPDTILTFALTKGVVIPWTVQ